MNALRELECPVCLEYMTKEIAICNNGHSICQKCKNKLHSNQCPICDTHFTSGRNYALEDIATKITIICKDVCTWQSTTKDIKKHEITGNFQKHPCTFYFKGCPWKGKEEHIECHILSAHFSKINRLWLYEKENIFVQVVLQFGHLFAICSKENDKKVNWAAMCIQPMLQADQFQLVVNYNNSKRKGLRLKMTVPCIPNCDVEEIFNTDTIVIFHETLKNLEFSSAKILLIN